MKILPVIAELFHAEGRTDGQTDKQADLPKLIVAFRNFAKVFTNRGLFTLTISVSYARIVYEKKRVLLYCLLFTEIYVSDYSIGVSQLSMWPLPHHYQHNRKYTILTFNTICNF